MKKPRTVCDMVFSLLSGETPKMHIQVILDALERLPVKKPSRQSLSTMLSRDERFIRVGNKWAVQEKRPRFIVAHTPDCEIGDNYKDCPACRELSGQKETRYHFASRDDLRGPSDKTHHVTIYKESEGASMEEEVENLAIVISGNRCQILRKGHACIADFPIKRLRKKRAPQKI